MMETPNTLNSGMCRCCSSEGTFKDIKTKYHWMGEEEIYADMLTDCFDIKIQTPEDMDNGICEVCITQLRNAVNFKKQVLHTEEQFKRRLQGRDIKNPIKIESLEESVDSDHLSDPDFGEEYEVPIKQEEEDKPKPKKRAAKPAATRAKKSKTEAETSAQHVTQHTPPKTKHIAASGKKLHINVSTSSLESSAPVKRRLKNKPVLKKKCMTDLAKTQKNLEIILLNSNATPIRGYRGIGYTCYFCPKEFPEPSDLKTHTLESHGDLKQDPRLWRRPSYNESSVKMDITNLQCKICCKSFALLSEFIDHMRIDHDQPIETDVKNYLLPFRLDAFPIKCVLCDADFSAFSMAIKHMNRHYRNFICDFCDDGFVNKGSMLAHKKKHESGDYQCDQCHKTYDSAAKLKYHIGCVHQGKDKRFKCGYCGDKFTRFAMKHDHLVKVHGVGPTEAKCKACDKTFRNYESLRVHYRSYHLQTKKMKALQKSK